MLITGVHKCEHCGFEIEWEYIIPQHWTRPQAQRLDNKKEYPQKIGELNKNSYLFQLRCRNCNRLTNFTYYNEKRL